MPLPAGDYQLTATAYSETSGGGEEEGRLTVSFTVVESAPTPGETTKGSQPVSANLRATGAPAIVGNPRVSETLTADTTGIADEDGLTNVVFSYQWVRIDGATGANIEDATGSSYTLTEDDEGKAITVTVSFTDDANNQESLTSAETGAVAGEAGPLTGFRVVDTSGNSDTVLGRLEDGGTLTLEDPTSDRHGIRVDTDSNDDIDKVELALSGTKTEGKTEGVFPYSLYGDEGEGNLTGEDLPVGGYQLTATAYDEDGDVLGTLTVSFTVAEYQPPVEEQQTAQANNHATGAPTISGTAQVGETLTASTSGIADADGLDTATFSYQWLADDVHIAGASGSSYTLTSAEQGKAITVTVTFTDDAGHQETRTSAPTAAVAAAANSRATGVPTISGTAQVGQTLTADTSGIADVDGLDNVTFSYQWMADDTNIQGATNRTYTLADRDEGKTIKVIVSFTDDANNEESLPSAATDAVTALPGEPQSLAGEATAQKIKLTWNAPTGDTVVEYVVYRGTLQNGSMNGQALTKYATIDAVSKAMTYTDDNVEEGVEYRYRVAAVNSDGEGEKSNRLDITAEDSTS